MKRLIVAMLLCMTVHICLAQEEKDKMLSDYRENVERLWAKHYTARNRIVRQYEERREKLWEEHEAFRRKVMAQWGDLVMVESTKKEWVEYSEDQTRRSIVDFENGKVTVEIIADPEEDEADIDSSLEKAMEDLLSI